MNPKTKINHNGQVTVKCINCKFGSTFKIIKRLNTFQFWCYKCHANNLFEITNPETVTTSKSTSL